MAKSMGAEVSDIVVEEGFTESEIDLDPILKYFEYRHLRPELQAVSRPFFNLARQITLVCPRNAERTAALRKLLEAKDCAVRAALP